MREPTTRQVYMLNVMKVSPILPIPRGYPLCCEG